MEANAKFKVGDRVKVIAKKPVEFEHLQGMVDEVVIDGRHCVYKFKSFTRQRQRWFPGEELELLPNDGTNNPEISDSSTAANTLEIPNSCESAPVEAEVLTQAKTLQRVLYLAGPMRGIAFYNFPMFDRVAAALRDVGYEVINPADEDRKEDDFDPTFEPKFANPANCVVQPGMDFGKIIRR